MASAELWGSLSPFLPKPVIFLFFYCYFTSIETIGELLVWHAVLSGAGSPGRLPWLSHSSWTLKLFICCPLRIHTSRRPVYFGVTTAFRGRYHLDGPHLDYHMPIWLAFSARALERDTLWDIEGRRAEERFRSRFTTRVDACVHNL